MGPKEHAEYIESKKHYLARNAQLFEIYQGDLLKYVRKIMLESLSPEYFEKIKSRIYPINILKRVVDKLAQSYRDEPTRTATSNADILSFYEDQLSINMKMNLADEFSHLFKGYALEPFAHKGAPSLRVIPFDRFLTRSTDIIDPLRLTHFYKYIGKQFKSDRYGKKRDLDVWFVYTDETFEAIYEDGSICKELMIDTTTGEPLNGENPLGFIPFMFGNRSSYNILPVQDTDTLELAKLLPVQLSDLAGAVLFQCFSIIYGIDVDSENMTMSPNAFWSLKSDPASDKTPSVGTIKPEVDVDKVMGFIKDTFSTWMETKGIRVGAIGNTDAGGVSSGISKIIDEMDTFEARNKSIEYFIKEEFEFWQLLKKMHNYWVANGMIEKQPLLPENWEVSTEFDPPRPMVDRREEVDVAVIERDNRVISQRSLIKKLYPRWSEEDIDKELQQIELESEI
jgi:hypothetical protein